MEELKNALNSDFDIIRLGNALAATELMATKYKDELSSTFQRSFRRYALGISKYLRQISERAQLIENGVNVILTDEEAAEIIDYAVVLTEELSTQPEAIDPKVPRTIQFFIDLARRPGQTTKNGLFALICALENLVVAFYNYTADFIAETAKKAKKTGSRVAALLLLSTALGTSGILPEVVTQITGSNWMEELRPVLKEVEAFLKQWKPPPSEPPPPAAP